MVIKANNPVRINTWTCPGHASIVDASKRGRYHCHPYGGDSGRKTIGEPKRKPVRGRARIKFRSLDYASFLINISVSYSTFLCWESTPRGHLLYQPRKYQGMRIGEAMSQFSRACFYFTLLFYFTLSSPKDTQLLKTVFLYAGYLPNSRSFVLSGNHAQYKSHLEHRGLA